MRGAQALDDLAPQVMPGHQHDQPVASARVPAALARGLQQLHRACYGGRGFAAANRHPQQHLGRLTSAQPVSEPVHRLGGETLPLGERHAPVGKGRRHRFGCRPLRLLGFGLFALPVARPGDTRLEIVGVGVAVDLGRAAPAWIGGEDARL